MKNITLILLMTLVGFRSHANNWQRDEVNLLSGFNNMYNPHVVKVPGDTYPYKMYFFGWASYDCNPGYPGCDSTYLARSQSLDGPWEVYCDANGWQGDDQIGLWVPIITADNKFYDQWHNGDSSVVYKDGTYYMAYSSTGFDLDGINPHDPATGSSDTDGFISVVMGATSTDGINWTRSTYPILMYYGEIGKLELYEQDLLYTGNFHRPSLMWDEDHWRLWFDYWPPGGGIAMGHAECYGNPMDSADWIITHDLDSPLLPEWPNPDIIKYDGRYYSVADPPGYGLPGWPNRQIREAISDDGFKWVVLDFIEPDSDTPANQVPELYVETINGQDWMYIFYACQIGGEPYDWRFDRIRYMKRIVQPVMDRDFNRNGIVDICDLCILTDNWLGNTRP